MELSLLEGGAVGLAGVEGPHRVQGQGEFFRGGGAAAVVVTVGRPVFAAGGPVAEEGGEEEMAEDPGSHPPSLASGWPVAMNFHLSPFGSSTWGGGQWRIEGP